MKETYLGDGVYATFDGWNIWLACRGQRELTRGPNNIPGIALEPVVVQALMQFTKECGLEPIEQEGPAQDAQD